MAPRDVATVAANNACCVLIGERRPLGVDLRQQLADSIQHASGTARETLPNHRRLVAAAQAAEDVRRLIAVVSSVRSEPL